MLTGPSPAKPSFRAGEAEHGLHAAQYGSTTEADSDDQGDVGDRGDEASQAHERVSPASTCLMQLTSPRTQTALWLLNSARTPFADAQRVRATPHTARRAERKPSRQQAQPWRNLPASCVPHAQPRRPLLDGVFVRGHDVGAVGAARRGQLCHVL